MINAHSSYSDPTPSFLMQQRPFLHYDGEKGLMLGEHALQEIAEQFGTACWVVSGDILQERALKFKEAFTPYKLPLHFHFAVKSQDHLAALTLLKECGFGADVVSGGELQRALKAGISGKKIVFSGIGKTDDEICLAIETEIAQINIESKEELYRIDALAQKMGKKPRISLRINPDIDAKTHDKITTGRAEDKFGIAYKDILPLYRLAQKELKNIQLIGLAVHLGSQILTKEPYQKGYERLAEIVRMLRAEGFKVEEIDCGGGLGIAYRDEKTLSISEYAQIITETLGGLDVTLRLEPGRWISAPAGFLLSKVTEIKSGEREFVILDAGMTELMRPALYEAFHGILPLRTPTSEEKLKEVDIVGPICETSDVFARQRPLPALKRGDYVAFLDAGAYGSVMSSHYNTRSLAPHILIHGKNISIIRRKIPLEEILAQDIVPDFLSPLPDRFSDRIANR